MATIERRLTDLEQAGAGYLGPLVLTVPEYVPIEERVSPEQQRQIDEANKAGRIVVFVRRFSPAESQ